MHVHAYNSHLCDPIPALRQIIHTHNLDHILLHAVLTKMEPFRMATHLCKHCLVSYMHMYVAIASICTV